MRRCFVVYRSTITGCYVPAVYAAEHRASTSEHRVGPFRATLIGWALQHLPATT